MKATFLVFMYCKKNSFGIRHLEASSQFPSKVNVHRDGLKRGNLVSYFDSNKLIIEYLTLFDASIAIALNIMSFCGSGQWFIFQKCQNAYKEYFKLEMLDTYIHAYTFMYGTLLFNKLYRAPPLLRRSVQQLYL